MPYETFDLFNTLQHLSPAAVEQCRSSPAASFIRAYKGACRFTPLDPDYKPIDCEFTVGARPPSDNFIVPVFYEQSTTES